MSGRIEEEKIRVPGMKKKKEAHHRKAAETEEKKRWRVVSWEGRT